MIEMKLQLFGGRGSSSGGGGGGGGANASTEQSGPNNQSDKTRGFAKNAQENNSQYQLRYIETMDGSTWIMSGRPKGPKSERGNSAAEISPNHGKEGFTVSRWTYDGDRLPDKSFNSLGPALQTAKTYLRSGWKNTK